jgi:hypothetical protein
MSEEYNCLRKENYPSFFLSRETMIKRYLSVGSLKNRVRDFIVKKKPESHLQILLYHRILNPDEMDFLSDLGMVHTSTKNFEDHLRWLKHHNYTVINFKQVSEYLDNGQ